MTMYAMAIREMLTASPASLGAVLSNGKRYVVPIFQRDYAWEEEEWEALWTDITATIAAGEEDHHFLGALVLQPDLARGCLQIIDGQQRLATLTLLALAVISLIELIPTEGEKLNNHERVRLLRERFISTKDSASLQHTSRLTLNETDDSFFQNYLIQGKPPPRPASLKGSEKRLYQCFSYFKKQLQAYLGPDADGVRLATFLEHDIANRLQFIEIQVEKDETAFGVFETLNARGVALGTTDLLKNYLFAEAARGGGSDLNQARLSWTRALRFVPQDEIASLLYHKLAGEIQGIKERRVFVELKRLVPKHRPLFDFLRGLESAAELYSALDNPEDDFWTSCAPDARRWIRVLATLRTEQFKAVALAAFDKLADRPEKLTRLFRNLAFISVRVNISRVNTGDVLRAYQETAFKVEHGEIKSPMAIARSLASITPSDDDFRNAFAAHSIDPKGPRKKFLRYLLAELESESSGVPTDSNAGDVTIEHILPENPGLGWDEFSASDREQYCIRLGNLTLLEAKLNRSIGSAPFEDKKAVYCQSSFKLTREIDSLEWTPAAVQERQKSLAELAVKIWTLPTDD